MKKNAIAKVIRDYEQGWAEMNSKVLANSLLPEVNFEHVDLGRHEGVDAKKVASLHDYWFFVIRLASIPSIKFHCHAHHSLSSEHRILNFATHNDELFFQFIINFQSDGISEISIILDNFVEVLEKYGIQPTVSLEILTD